MITLKGKEFEFSFTNVDNLEKWDEGRKKVEKKYKKITENKLKNDISLSDYAKLLKDMCYAIFELFDNTLGEGASEKIFGNTVDFEVCVDVYLEFEAQMLDQYERLSNKTSRIEAPIGEKGK